MASPPDYLEVNIDVFEQKNQRAQVVPELSPAELVNAILEEFGDDLDYLGSDAAQYQLRKADAPGGLDNSLSVGEQLSPGDRLVLEELEPTVPNGTEPASVPIYLQDVAGHRSFRIGFLPAYVGRQDTNLAGNDLVAVDLSTASGGSNVSRRHLKLWEESGEFWVQAASNNPAAVVRTDRTEVAVAQPPQKTPLRSLDVIRLDRSGLTLKFIVRGELP